MNIPIQRETCRTMTTMAMMWPTTMRPWFASVVLVILTFSLPASAELGGYVDSVQVDRAKMKATIKITQTKAYLLANPSVLLPLQSFLPGTDRL